MDTDPFRNYKPNLGLPDPIGRIVKIAKGIGNLFVMHQLASHGDHSFEHPLDTPIEPVTDWPDGTQQIN